jgi:hypothetical protein
MRRMPVIGANRTDRRLAGTSAACPVAKARDAGKKFRGKTGAVPGDLVDGSEGMARARMGVVGDQSALLFLTLFHVRFSISSGATQMRSRASVLGCLISLLVVGGSFTQALGQAVTTIFTYQGVLKQSGNPLNATVDLRFRLYDAAVGGNQVGTTQALNNASIVDGLVTANIDFGVNAFTGNSRWIQIDVNPTPNGGVGPFTPLTPRQELKAVPYAMYALSGNSQWVSNGTALNYTDGNVSVGTTTQNGRVTIYPATGGGIQTGLYVRNTDTTNQYSVSNFISDSPAGIAIQASVASAGGSTGRAISATNNSSTGWAGYFVGRGYFSDSVGIGTTGPLALLHISRPSGDSTDPLRISTNTGSPLFITSTMTATGSTINTSSSITSAASMQLNNVNAGNVILAGGGGSVGIGNELSPSAKMQIVEGTDAEPTGGGYLALGPDTSTNLRMDNNEIMAVNNGAPATLFLNNDGGDVTISPAGTGRLITRILQITGGSDLSEQFEVSATSVTPAPGMVVVIDPNNPGQLIPACGAYDRKVAGVISGAGGVATGMMMSQSGTIADGEHPVALTGRVYCLADAAHADIEPGDMLTTSDTPGHAMKALDPDRSHGAIIGKAMTALPRGERGLVLVLVNLQ